MAGRALLLVVLAVAGTGLYFLPTIVGAARGAGRMGAIFLLNLLFGWSLVGWLAVPPPGPPPGWYPDPGGSGGLRLWDGRAWTGQLRPRR